MTIEDRKSTGAERAVLRYAQQVELKASPQKSWDAIKDFDSIHLWHPATEGTVLLVGERGAPLAVREFQVKGGGFVISELLAYEEEKKWFRYRIIKTSLPLSNYVAEMWVEPAADGGSLVSWSTAFQRPDGGAEPDEADGATERLVQGVVMAGLENLPALTSANQP